MDRRQRRSGFAWRRLLEPRSIFILALAAIALSGRWRVLLAQCGDPLGLVAGLLAGVLLYWTSLSVIIKRPLSLITFARTAHSGFVRARPAASRVVILGGRALYEEAFWRGTLQFLLGNGFLGVTVTALLFTARHAYLERIQGRPLKARLLAELAVFSLLLGCIYAATDRLMLVIGIHWMRNVLISVRCTVPDAAPTTAPSEL